ncbi:MAG TPA: M48 family metalloprotease [Steroidobacteraceae bacterium]|nr:M48 family metalloprotease [Steroidobacteraceae bacterium]
MTRALPICALTALLTLATAASAQETAPPPAAPDLPDMGSPAAAVLSGTDEYRLGAMVIRGFRDQNALIEDPEVSEYLNAVGAKLAAMAPDGAPHFQFFAFREGAINAFALPGGFICVNYGLILQTRNESELAGVMAHEMAHVTQHHIARQIRAQSQQSLASAAAMLAAIVLGSLGGGGGQAIEGGIAAAQGLAAQQQINFTRDNEAEADRVGIGFLYGAGFDPRAMADFFETIGRTQGLTATYIPAMLQDHPVTSVRVAEARARAAQFGPVKVKESLSYLLIRERLRVLTAPGDTDIEKQYAQRMARGNADIGTRYGDALALMADNRPVEAEKILHTLTEQHQGLTLLHAALGQAQMKAGQTNDGLASLHRAVDLFPRNVPVTIRYAEALMKAGRAKEAHSVLLDLFNNVPPTPEQIRLTALAASAAGDQGDAYFYMGEYQIAGGDLPLAAQQLQLALATPNLTQVQRQRYQARLDEVREYLASTRVRRVSNTE